MKWWDPEPQGNSMGSGTLQLAPGKLGGSPSMTELESGEVRPCGHPSRNCSNMLRKKGISAIFNFRGHLTIPLI